MATGTRPLKNPKYVRRTLAKDPAEAGMRVPTQSKSTDSTNTAAAQENRQWPASQTSKPYPEMPVVPLDRPLLSAYGATGTAFFGGVIQSDEYNSDFYWKDGIKIYEQMTRGDAQVNAIRQMMELPIRRATWSIKPASKDARDVEIASFVESCLFHDMTYTTSTGRVIRQKWDDILRHILMHLWFGFMPFEVCWKIEDGWVKWAQWMPLLPRTLWRWWVGEDNELAGVQQWTFKNYSYQFIDIPADKLLTFTYRQEGQNFEGVPLLRSAYRPWYFKTTYEKIEAIGVERNSVVPPIVRLPPNHTPNDAKQALQIAQNMRVSEMMGIVIPNDWDIEYPKNQERYSVQIQPIIQYHDIMIARNVLAQFINLGSTETGSYALADSQVQTFLSSLQAIAEYIEDVINTDAIRRLVDMNYENVEVYPELRCSKLQGDVTIISTALKNLTMGTVPLITPDAELEDWLRDQLGLPSASVSPVTTTNPTSPVNPQRPENGLGATSQESTPRNTTNAPDPQADRAALLDEVRLLRETIGTMDAVERGVSMRMSNEYPRQKGGNMGHSAHPPTSEKNAASGETKTGQAKGSKGKKGASGSNDDQSKPEATP